MNPVFNQQGKSDHHHVTADVPYRSRWCDLSADLLIVMEVWKGCGKPLRETGRGGVIALWDGGCGVRLHTMHICDAVERHSTAITRIRTPASPGGCGSKE
jgi:hypothetical protein